VSRIFLGPVTRIRVDVSGGDQGITADVPTARARPLAIGSRVVASFPSDSGRLLSLAEQPESVGAGLEDH
jgi:hypothetical protein